METTEIVELIAALDARADELAILANDADGDQTGAADRYRAEALEVFTGMGELGVELERRRQDAERKPAGVYSATLARRAMIGR